MISPSCKLLTTNSQPPPLSASPYCYHFLFLFCLVLSTMSGSYSPLLGEEEQSFASCFIFWRRAGFLVVRWLVASSLLLLLFFGWSLLPTTTQKAVYDDDKYYCAPATSSTTTTNHDHQHQPAHDSTGHGALTYVFPIQKILLGNLIALFYFRFKSGRHTNGFFYIDFFGSFFQNYRKSHGYF